MFGYVSGIAVTYVDPLVVFPHDIIGGVSAGEGAADVVGGRPGSALHVPMIADGRRGEPRVHKLVA
jgi:hypothetical protein